MAKTGVFLERDFVSRKTSGSTFNLEEVLDMDYSTEALMEVELEPQSVVDDKIVSQGVEEQQPVQVDLPLRRSDRVRRQPERYSFLLSDHDDTMHIENEPTSYQEVVMRSDSEKWLEAMRSEMQSMYINQV